MGVLLSIQPWNYPYYQLARFAGPHLMSGNVMLVKHAPGAPQCALAFEHILRDAGVPEGVYTNLFLSNDQAGALIDDPRVKGIALTGSERAGEALASRAGKNLKKSTMELGGSDAFIVLDDANLDHTVAMAVLGRFGNNGQTCIGAKRFIVVESLMDAFLSRFVAAAKDLKVGDPFDETVTLGPLSSESALQLILRQIEEAKAHGTRVALGGRRKGSVGAFLEPTILTGITKDNPAYRQESQGSGYTAGARASTAALNCTLRSGHTAEDKAEMLQKLWAMFQRMTGIATGQLAISLQEIPSTNAMELGKLMQPVGDRQ